MISAASTCLSSAALTGESESVHSGGDGARIGSADVRGYRTARAVNCCAAAKKGDIKWIDLAPATATGSRWRNLASSASTSTAFVGKSRLNLCGWLSESLSAA